MHNHIGCDIIYNTFYGNKLLKEVILKMTSELIERINVLARKSRAEGLTPEEKEEQAKLRQQYIAGFRQGMTNTLENVYIVDEAGNKKKVEKKKK